MKLNNILLVAGGEIAAVLANIQPIYFEDSWLLPGDKATAIVVNNTQIITLDMVLVVSNGGHACTFPRCSSKHILQPQNIIKIIDWLCRCC